MVRLADVSFDAGSADNAVKDLTAAVADAGSQTQQTTKASGNTQTQTNQNVDQRFAGKSTDQVVDMYKNLESHSGRLANRLGQVEQNLNQLILGKRESDLRKGGNREPVKIQPGDLMVNPTEALDRYLDSRGSAPEVSALQERLAQLENRLTQSTFETRHQDAQNVTADPAFQAWARQTPLRLQLANDAANGNMASADLLLQEWKFANSSSTNNVSTASSRAQELANRVSLETSNTSSEGGNGQKGTSSSTRRFKRADLIALRQRDPEKYESTAFQNEIVRAYQEGRVVD